MSVTSKAEIRSRYKKLRECYSPEQKARRDIKISEKLINLDEYIKCDKVLVFISKDIEVSTERIIAKAFSDGKIVVAPRCNPDNTLSFYIIRSNDDLERGYYGLSEPKESCAMLNDYNNSICLVPGLAYDADGFRVGFGKGFYDRFLPGYTGVSIGVCYSDCIIKQIPRDRYDCSVDILITDKNVIRKDNGYE